MSSTEVGSAPASEEAELSTIDMALEVVTVPVSDVDRAKSFYQSLGWRLDIDLVISDDIRNVQFTPPHSPCSIHVGKGLTAMEPGSLDRLILQVKDIEAAREDLISRGVDVSEVENQRPPGFDSPGTLVLPVRVLQRPGRQQLAAARDHEPATRPGMGGLTWTSQRWQTG